MSLENVQNIFESVQNKKTSSNETNNININNNSSIILDSPMQK